MHSSKRKDESSAFMCAFILSRIAVYSPAPYTATLERWVLREKYNILLFLEKEYSVYRKIDLAVQQDKSEFKEQEHFHVQNLVGSLRQPC